MRRFRRLMRLYVTPVRLPDKQASRSAAPYPRYVRHLIVPPYRLTKNALRLQKLRKYFGGIVLGHFGQPINPTLRMAIFFIFVRDAIPYFCKQPIDAYQGNRLRPRAWRTVGSLLTNRLTGPWAREPSGSVGCAFSIYSLNTSVSRRTIRRS